MEGLNSVRTSMFRWDANSAGLFARSEITVLVYLRPCGIGGRVGLVLEPGYVTVIADSLLCWATFSCIDDATRRARKHQEERETAHAVSPLVHKERKFRIPAPQSISDKYHPQMRWRASITCT